MPQGQNLVWATRSRPPNLFVWSLERNQPVAQLGEDEFPSVLDATPDGRVLVTGDSRGVLRVWDPSTGALLRSFTRLGRVLKNRGFTLMMLTFIEFLPQLIEAMGGEEIPQGI